MIEDLRKKLGEEWKYALSHQWVKGDGNAYVMSDNEYNKYLEKELNRQDKIIGSIVAGAIGDSIGYKITNQKRKKIKNEILFDDVEIVSSNTQMTLYTICALLYKEINKDVSYSEAFYYSYLDWFDTQNKTNKNFRIAWIKCLPELNVNRGAESICLKSLKSGEMGCFNNILNKSNGCGAITRVAPIGLCISDPVEAGVVAIDASLITHGHLLSYYSSFILVSLIGLIIDNYKEKLENLVLNSLELFKKTFPSLLSNNDIVKMMDLIYKAIELSKSDDSDSKSRSILGKGNVAEEVLAIAIYSCLKHQNSINDAICCAVNYDENAASIGSVAGNIIGVYLGLKKIPKEYIEKLEMKELIITLSGYISKDLSMYYYEDNYFKYKYDSYS